jgi:hypothetical protein
MEYSLLRLSSLLCCCKLFIAALFFSQTAAADDPVPDLNAQIVTEKGDPIPFRPFTLDEVCKEYTASGSCQTRYQPGERVRLATEKIIDGVRREVVLFQGTAEEYVAMLNDKEKYFNALGRSLRTEGDEILRRHIPVDVRKLRTQLLEAIKAKAQEVLPRVKDPLVGGACPSLPEFSNDINNQTIQTDDGDQLKVGDVAGRLRDSQAVLCALGYNAFEGLNLNNIPNAKEFLRQAIIRRDRLLEELGLSKYMGLFNLASFASLKSFQEIVQVVEEIAQAREVPGPEALKDKVQKLGAELPASIRIPPLPSIPAPTPPRKINLQIKKRKEWPGFNVGTRSLVAIGSSAYLEVRGDEKREQVAAEGKGSVYLLSNEINVVYGYGAFYAGPDKVEANMKLAAFGFDLFPPIQATASARWVKEERTALGFRREVGYSQTFMIGPIPVAVKIGTRAGMGLGYKIGLETTQIIAEITPRTFAEGFAEAGIGVAGFLSAGAGASLTILDLSLPLSGSSGFRFDEVGYPFLRLDIGAKVRIVYLDGRVYAYVEYPVPDWGLPPWEIKKDSLTIFSWQGNRMEHSIMSWGMDIGRAGVISRGDLVDQTDREEAAALSQAVLLGQKQQELAKYEQRVWQHTRDTFSGVLQDLGSPANRELAVVDRAACLYRQQYAQNLKTFAETVAAIAVPGSRTLPSQPPPEVCGGGG